MKNKNKCEQRSTKKSAAVETQGLQKSQNKGTELEVSALATPVTFGGPVKAASALMPKAASALAKAGGVTQRGPELSAAADLSAKTAEPSKKQAVSKASEAVPTPEREQASDVLKQVRLHLSPETRSATVNLKPAELGRVSIRIVVDGDQVLPGQFIFQLLEGADRRQHWRFAFCNVLGSLKKNAIAEQFVTDNFFKLNVYSMKLALGIFFQF